MHQLCEEGWEQCLRQRKQHLKDSGRRGHGEMRLVWPELRKLEASRMQGDAEIVIPENQLHSDQAWLKENKT